MAMTKIRPEDFRSKGAPVSMVAHFKAEIAIY